MKRIAGVLMGLALAFSVQAEGVGFQFRDVGVSAFLDAVVRGVLGRDYVMPSALAADHRITISIKSLDKDQVLEVTRSALASVGLGLSDKGGVLFVDRLGGPMVQHAAGPVPVLEAAKGGAEPDIGSVLGSVKDAVSSSDLVRVYRPRHRSAEFLAAVVKLAGAKPLEAKTGRDVLVYAVAEDRAERVDALLADADGKVGAVSVRAAVLEVSDGSDGSRSFSGVLSLLGGRLGMSLKLGKAGDNAVKLDATNLDAVLSAVDGDSRFRYVAEPRLRVLDGEKAKLTVGQDVPVRGALTQAANGSQLQAVEYKTAGVVLTLAPTILAESVQIKVGQQVSSVASNSSSGIDSPVILRREAETTVDARPGEVVLIAGMDETREASTRTGVPWLPAFVDATTVSKGRSQIVVLLEVHRI